MFELFCEVFFEGGGDVAFSEVICFGGNCDFGSHLTCDAPAVFSGGRVYVGVLVDNAMFGWFAAFFFVAEECFFGTE